MSSAKPIPATLVDPAPRQPPVWWHRVDSFLDWAGEWLNPILVKECRQALKSKQFLITFTLLLVCGWIWSLVGAAFYGPGFYYSFSNGPTMFFGYYIFFAFPLLVVVPFGAYRSLAVEREDQTFELLAISTLRPRQIVAGKLGSAIVQMLVYFSAISPCLAFTYLLRGIDLLSIVFILYYTFLGSLAFSLLALLLATLTRERHWQIVMSVIIIVGLFVSFICALQIAGMLIWYERIPFASTEFLIFNLVLVTVFASYFLLCYLAACAQLTFASDNRSTKLRYAMLLQHALLIGWVGWGWHQAEFRDDLEVIAIFLTFIGVHWYVMGAMMTGESGILSRRTRRELPQSFLGRMLLSWFNPGPTLGYFFAVANLIAAVLMALWATSLYGSKGSPAGGVKMSAPFEYMVCFSVLLVSFVTIYLGIGNLLLTAMRRIQPVSLFLTLLIHFLLLLTGVGTPLIIRGLAFGWRDEYFLLQISDPFSTLIEAGRGRMMLTAPAAPVILGIAALVVFLLNLPLAARELRQTRIARPQRVEQEDAELAAAHAPPPEPNDPWEAEAVQA